MERNIDISYQHHSVVRQKTTLHRETYNKISNL